MWGLKRQDRVPFSAVRLIRKGAYTLTMLARAQAVCPIDGVEYEYRKVMSCGMYGSDLDGRPISLLTMPHVIPACPECRFPQWISDLSPQDLERARTVVASPEYEAATREASYLHYDFLLDALGRGTPRTRLNNAIKACWETDPGDPRYPGYALRVVEAYREAGDEPDAHPEDRAAFQCALANILRQAGFWDEALERLDAIDPEKAEPANLAARIAQTRKLVMERDRDRHAKDARRERAAD